MTDIQGLMIQLQVYFVLVMGAVAQTDEGRVLSQTCRRPRSLWERLLKQGWTPSNLQYNAAKI